MSVLAIPEPVTINIAGQADRGKFREENKAVVRHARTQFGDLLVLADGIGDTAAAGEASRKAADIISSRIEAMPAFFPSEIAVEEAIRQASTELTAMAAVPDSPYSSVGVTVIVALLRTDGDRAHVTIGRVGDSRAYLVRDRKLALLTRGPSATPGIPEEKRTRPQEEDTYPDPSMPARYQRNRLNLDVEMHEMPLRAGDTLLLCSDGFWSHVSEGEMERVLADEARSVEEASRSLLNLARDAGGHENLAIEVARLTQSIRSPADAARPVKSQSEGLPKIAVTRATPAIEWPAPESIVFGTPLSDTQLNATSSVPGTLKYHPGPGAVLAAGEHTLSVDFRPSNQSAYTSAQAAVPLRVTKATPSINWPTPDPINNTTPLGAAQLNASASVPGTFAYRPAAGATLGTGDHTLAVTFTPADCVNYTQAQASVSLTVIESVPAVINWPCPASISYGTVLGDEQLNARSSVPGSFLYIPAPGNVLPPGEHKLTVIFLPEDRVKYTKARATVTLIVEALPLVAPPVNAALPTLVDSGVVAEPDAGTAERDELPHLARRGREAGDAADESAILPRSPHAAEVRASEPGTIEESQAEIPLFRAFGSSLEVEREEVEEEQETGSNWWGRNWLTIVSSALAIPMLCLLVFLVAKAHSGAPFITNKSVQPTPAAAETQPQSNTQNASHQVQMTVNQDAAGTGTEPASNSQQDNNKNATKPTQAQTKTTRDQADARTALPRGSKKQTAANERSSAGRAGGPGGRDSFAHRDTQSTDRDGASRPVAVSADAAAGRLMESTTPIYPPVAKASGVSGTVELDATISKDGTVKDPRVVSGPVQLRQAALHTVRTWRYKPFTRGNEPMEVQTTINVVFSLDK